MSVYITSTGKNILNIPESASGFDLNTRNQYFATILGSDAGAANQGMFNTLIGYKAGNKIVTGANNIMVGANAGLLALNGDNVLIGTNAGASIINASRNVCIGSSAGKMIVGNNNVLMGYNNTNTSFGAYNIVGIGGNQTNSGNASVCIGFQSQMSSDNSIIIGAESVNEADGSIIVGKNIINSGANSCIIKCYDGTLTTNSNDKYTNINGFIENSLLDASQKTKSVFQGDVINLNGSNVNILGKTFIEEQLNAPIANFTSNVQFLKNLNLCYSNLDNIHWQVFLDPKAMNMSDLLFRSRNNTIVTFTDDFQSELLNFTGKHRCSLSNQQLSNDGIDQLSKYYGRLVIASGDYCGLDGSSNIMLDEAIPRVSLCVTAYDPRVFGVISAVENAGSTRTYKLGNLQFNNPKTTTSERKVVVNSHGEGAIWICNVNGNFRNGDLIVSSGIKGFGMRQPSDVCRSYTVGKITCNCDFSISSKRYICRYFTWKGKIMKKALVGCVYKI